MSARLAESRRSFTLLTVAVVAGSVACASLEEKAPPAEAAPGDAPAMAKVEAQFIPDPARIAPHLEAGQDFVSPHPIVTHLPQYPAGHEAAGPVVIVLRFVVGEKGAVRDVRDSPLGDPVPAGDAVSPPADPAFRQAAVDAVLGWLFVPAAIRTVKPGADLDGDSKPDYTVLVDSERVPVYLDVRFTFEMVEGKGQVRID